MTDIKFSITDTTSIDLELLRMPAPLSDVTDMASLPIDTCYISMWNSNPYSIIVTIGDLEIQGVVTISARNLSSWSIEYMKEGTYKHINDLPTEALPHKIRNLLEDVYV